MFAQSFWAWLLCAVCAYLIGSVSGAIVASYWRHHEDIRKQGSGNAGMTNALRTYGVRNAVLVTAIDLLKTIAAILLGRLLIGPYGVLLAGACAVIGHVFPIYYHFKGGKGVMCAAAILLMIDWKLFLIVVGGFFTLGVVCSKRVSVGSLTACASAPFACMLLHEGQVNTLFVTGLALFVVVLHHENIRRLIKGEEKPTVVAKRRKS